MHRAFVTLALFPTIFHLAADARPFIEEPLGDETSDYRASPAEAVTTNETATTAQAQRRRGGGRFGGRIEGMYKAQITPHWFAHNSRFWYRNDLRGGDKEFILVDAEQGKRQEAFDHRYWIG